jgi:hypothetical protein
MDICFLLAVSDAYDLQGTKNGQNLAVLIAENHAKILSPIGPFGYTLGVRAGTPLAASGSLFSPAVRQNIQ